MSLANSLRLPSIVLLCGAALVGCSPQTGYVPPTAMWSEVEAPSANKVRLVRFAHPVSFPQGSAALPPAEAVAFGQFISDTALRYGDDVLLVTSEGDGLAAKRRSVLSDTLIQRGIRPRPATVPAPALPAGQVLVQVSRHVLTPAPCGYWNSDSGRDGNNLTLPNLGCANTRNLGLMVANPADLLGRGESTPADAGAAALAVQRYRQDKTKPLPGINQISNLGK